MNFPVRDPQVSLRDTLKSLRVGDTILFPMGSNNSSIRSTATQIGIKIHIWVMPEGGQIQVTRRL